MTDEYISREAAVKALSKGFIVSDDLYGMGVQAGLKYARCKIEQTPTADVAPVVRCKDCKYGSYDSKSNGAMVCLRTNDGFWRKETDFCSYGERREE